MFDEIKVEFDEKARKESLDGKTLPGSAIEFTQKYERIKSCLYLRPHRKVRTVKAVTRDGVDVEIELMLDLAISKPPDGDSFTNPYPFDPRQALRVAYIEAEAEGETVDWTERAFSIAANCLSQIITRYNIRQLYNYYVNNPRAGPTPYQFLEEELEIMLKGLPKDANPPPTGPSETSFSRFKGFLEDMGIHLLELRLGPLRVRKEVLDQTITEWEAELEVEQAILEAEADAAFWTEMEQAKAQALQEITESIFKSFIELQHRGLNQEVIVLRLIKALEELASHPLTQRMLSDRTRSRLGEFGLLKGVTRTEG